MNTKSYYITAIALCIQITLMYMSVDPEWVFIAHGICAMVSSLILTTLMRGAE